MKRKMIVCMLAMIATCMSGHEVISEELTCERNGLNIYGVMYRPDTQGRLPAVVLSHSSSLTHAAMAGYAEKLAAEGYAAYCFDFCGGSSESLSDGSEEDMTVFTEVDDYGEVSIPNNRIQELILYLADLEDWLERKGLL